MINDNYQRYLASRFTINIIPLVSRLEEKLKKKKKENY